MKEKIIYSIRNIVNNKLYIGSTKNWKARRNAHKYSLRNNKSSSSSLQKDWNEYGESNFEFSIIEIVDDSIDMVYREEKFIMTFDSITNGYNMKLPYTEQNTKESTIEKISIKRKDYISKNPPYNLKHISKEEYIEQRALNPNFKVKIKVPAIPKHLHRERVGKKAVIFVDGDGIKSDERFESIFEATTFYNLSPRGISTCCKNNNKYNNIYKCDDKIWFFEEDYNYEKFYNTHCVYKEVPVIEKKPLIPYSERNIKRIPISIIKDLEVRDFKSFLECSKFLQCKPCKVAALIKGFRKKGKGITTNVLSVKGWGLNKINLVV